jgi:2'-deoxynucleoside 5'-phosphate N-hydrolase
MNIYFACSITGGREFEETYQAIVHSLLQDGHSVPTSFLARAEVIGLEKIVSPQDVFARDVAWINGCDALVAEVSTPSHGVGYEIAYALSLGKPVLCCYREGQQVSKMITGNSHPNIRVHTYRTTEEASAVVRAFLNGDHPAGGEAWNVPSL